MTAPYLGTEEARDEKASDDGRVPGDHGMDDGVWEFADGFGARLRLAESERLLRRMRRISSGSLNSGS